MLENSGNRRTLFSSNEKNNLPSELLIEAVKTIKRGYVLTIFMYHKIALLQVINVFLTGKMARLSVIIMG